ncbi:MAG: R3H domain-containing nucleic acid-binding protein [Patescibacteria group bacterium]
MQDITTYTQDLLAHMGVTEAEVAVLEEDENVVVQISVSDQESGMLIGHHGETIAALQRMMNISFRDKAEEKRIVVNVNDYKQKREEVLKNMAHRFAERAIESNVPQYLPFLPANERLIVHVELKDHPEVVTQSEGEGLQRRLVISLKN